MPESAAGEDSLATAVFEREQAAIAAIPDALKELPRDQIALKSFNLMGLDALQHLLDGTELPAERQPALTSEPLAAPTLAEVVNDIAADGRGFVMVMGKGGVGKTTLAAAVAVELAHRGLPVHLTTSDPAAHLAETLSGSLEICRRSAAHRRLASGGARRGAGTIGGGTAVAGGSSCRRIPRGRLASATVPPRWGR